MGMIVEKASEKLGKAGVGARAPKGLGVEGLESRLNLSTLSTVLGAVPSGAGSSVVQEVSTAKKYRIEALSAETAAAKVGKSFVNEKYADAQQFFNQFKSRYKTPALPTPVAPVTPTVPENVTPTPTPTPDPVPVVLPPVSVSQVAKGSVTRLVITGTTDNDSIVVSQSGSTVTIVANGQTQSVSGAFGELAIYGGAGNDSITVQSSVNIAALLYGGAGTNTITAAGSAKSFVVTLGGGNDTVTGNGLNTSFWADATDTVNASATETVNGGVHRVSGFYQPFSSDVNHVDYVPTGLNGQNLKDPTDSGTTVRLSNSLWGTGPLMTDINQGGVGDCYFLAPLQSLAGKQPGRLMEMAVDLGDGTYAVQFKRMGVTSVVRVDGDLPSGYWTGGLNYAHPGTAGGSMWAAIMEKAYAYFRTAGNTYASLNWGWTGSAFGDLGVVTTTFSAGSTASTLFNTLTTALANGKPIAAITNGTVGGVSVVASHAYSIIGTSVEGGVQFITLRNPWGTDGAGYDGVNDGVVKITLADFRSAFSAGSIMA